MITRDMCILSLEQNIIDKNDYNYYVNMVLAGNDFYYPIKIRIEKKINDAIIKGTLKNENR